MIEDGSAEPGKPRTILRLAGGLLVRSSTQSERA
jgi:hypothetical protein